MCVHTGGADEQHRACAELPTTDQQHCQPVQPAAFLEHVQQVGRNTHNAHMHAFAHTLARTPFIMSVLLQSQGPGDEPQWYGAERQNSQVSLQTQFHITVDRISL